MRPSGMAVVRDRKVARVKRGLRKCMLKSVCKLLGYKVTLRAMKLDLQRR